MSDIVSRVDILVVAIKVDSASFSWDRSTKYNIAGNMNVNMSLDN